MTNYIFINKHWEQIMDIPNNKYIKYMKYKERKYKLSKAFSGKLKKKIIFVKRKKSFINWPGKIDF